MSPGNTEWPMEAHIEYLNEAGEWVWSGSIRSMKIAKDWIAKRKNPERWRAVDDTTEPLKEAQHG